MTRQTVAETNASAILPCRRLRIYFASALSNTSLAKKLLSDWHEFDWVARWPQHHVGKVPDMPECLSVVWEHDIADIAKADVLLLYAKPTDALRGALVEAGAMLSLNRPVLLVGENSLFGTWQHHKLVRKVEDLGTARLVLRVMAT